MFFRKKKNASGSISVQIISKASGKYKVVKTIGSATNSHEVESLTFKAKQEIENLTRQPKLFGFDDDRMLGVPTYFRELNKDCLPDPYLHELIKSVDIVLAWMVQRFTPLVHNPKEHLRDHLIADSKWTKEMGVDYAPIAYPGFSWRNLSMHEKGVARYATYGAIPCLGGRFYWDQLTTFINTGAEMIYLAMFDEIDEGTAIMKVSDNPPTSENAQFVDNDGMPSDHYLWLSGLAAKMLRKEIPLEIEMPVRE